MNLYLAHLYGRAMQWYLTNVAGEQDRKAAWLLLLKLSLICIYSSSCSQTVSLSPAISSQLILGVCVAAENRKNQQNPLFWKFRVFQSHRA